MPLHDWTDRDGLEGLHTFWMTEIARDLKAKLPAGSRVRIEERSRLDVPEGATADDERELYVCVVKDGVLASVVELISPGNKDRPSARDEHGRRYTNYLREGVHLLLVDVHRRPLGFSFPQALTAALGPELPAPVAPSCVSYQVGAAAAMGGRMLAAWQYPLAVGEPLPSVELPISLDDIVMVDLEGTYSRAAADSYVE